MSARNQKRLTLEEALDEFMVLLSKIPPELQAAAVLLTVHLTTRLMSHLRHKGFGEADAEEMISDTWIKLLGSEVARIRQPRAYFWTVVGNVINDRLRMQSAAMRGDKERGIGEQAMDMDEFNDLLARGDGHDANVAEQIHLSRMLTDFETGYPEEAQLLLLKTEGYADEEIASVLGLKGGSAIRDRIHRARKAFEAFYATYGQLDQGQAGTPKEQS